MPVVPSHGAGIYYERHGRGPAVLFCHGAGSNAATWWQQLPVFARHFTCLSYDHRCFGRSPAAAASLVPQVLVDDALAILEREGVARAALVCQSLGGVTGLRFALQHADRVWAFVPCDSPLGISHPAMCESVARYLGGSATAAESRALARSTLESQPALAFLYAQIGRFNPSAHGDDAALRQALRALLSAPHLLPTQALAGLACPTLFVTGALDPLATPPLVRELALRVPGSEMVEIAGAGHSPYFEQPQAFNAAVLPFLLRNQPLPS